MSVTISDIALDLTTAGTTTPLIGAPVALTPTHTPVFLSISGVYHPLDDADLTTDTAADGSWSITAPTLDQVSDPTLQWALTLPDGTVYGGSLPASLAGLTLSLSDLTTGHGWGLISGGRQDPITTITGPNSNVATGYLEPYSRLTMGSEQGGIGSGTVYLMYATALSAVSISTFRAAFGAAASGLTLARMGLYTADGSGNLTLVARSADIHASCNGVSYTDLAVPFDTTGGYPASLTTVPGQRYAIALIQVGATRNNFYGHWMVGNGIAALSPTGTPTDRANGSVPGQSDLPSAIAAGSIGTWQDSIWLGVTP